MERKPFFIRLLMVFTVITLGLFVFNIIPSYSFSNPEKESKNSDSPSPYLANRILSENKILEEIRLALAASLDESIGSGELEESENGEFNLVGPIVRIQKIEVAKKNIWLFI